MTIRLSDIAHACEVDISTVSRALRNDPRVREDTRELIRRTADKMCYAPNLAARNLVAGTTQTLWLLLPDLKSPIQQEPAQFLSERLSLDGYDLMILLYHCEPEPFRRLLMRLTQNVADGAFIIPGGIAYDAPEYISLIKNKYPLVFIDRRVELKGGVTVTTDNGAAAEELSNRCIQGGADRFVIMFEASNSAGYERLQGAKQALSRKKIPYLVFNNPEKADAAFLKSGRTAILSSASSPAYAFYEHNKRSFSANPPIAGVFDQWVDRTDFFSGIYLCRQNFHDIAGKAADIMLNLLKGNETESGLYHIPPLSFISLKQP
jgi:DNA-binding LacI/PurR family transcriptional regulator